MVQEKWNDGRSVTWIGQMRFYLVGSGPIFKSKMIVNNIFSSDSHFRRLNVWWNPGQGIGTDRYVELCTEWW